MFVLLLGCCIFKGITDDTVFSIRMEHFQGEYFDNLFLHYRPKGPWYPGHYQINTVDNYR